MVATTIAAFTKHFSREAELAVARTVLSTKWSCGDANKSQKHSLGAKNYRAEFRSAEKNVSGTALKT